MLEGLAEHYVELAKEGAVYFRLLDERGVAAIAVYPLLFGKAQLALVCVPLGEIADCYYYASARQAIDAAKTWDGIGEPTVGWFRHPPSCRRRVNGDPNQETVRP